MAVTVPWGGQNFLIDGSIRATLYNVGGALLLFKHQGEVVSEHLGGFNAISMADLRADGRFIDAGDTNEFTAWSSQYPTFQDFFNYQLNTLISNPEARNDPTVRFAVAQRAARPDMGESEWEGLLKNTNTWKQHTQRQLEWNGLSPAEQSQQIQKAQESLADEYRKLTGKVIDFGGNEIVWWARQVASGSYTMGQAVNSWIKPIYMADQRSPGYLQLVSEDRARRVEDMEVGAKKADMRDLYEKWGIRLSDDALTNKAKAMQNNDLTEDQALEEAKTMSNAIYAASGKPPEIDVQTWAQPFISTYQRVLERGDPGVFEQHIQQAMLGGQNLYDFEKSLKSTGDWLQTKNAQQDIETLGSQIAKTMGY